MNRVHVIPVNDLIKHDTTDSDDDCVCGPDFQFESGSVLVLHHSLDGRELGEED